MDIYKIVSALDGLVMAVAGADKNDGTELIQYHYTDDQSQQWQLVPVGANRYKIVSLLSDKVVAIGHASRNQGQELIQYHYTGDPSQQWEIVPIEGNFFKIVSPLSRQVVAVAGASTKEAEPLIQYHYTADNSQEWQVVWIDESQSICKIVSLLSGQVMAVAGNSTDDGTELIQYHYTGAPSQQWQLVPVGAKTYKIVSVLSGKVVAISNASKKEGAPLIQYHYTGDPSQQWELAPLQPLSKIVSALTGQVVAVGHASKKEGENLIQYPYTGDSSQQWKLIKVSVEPMTTKEIEEAISRYGPILKFHPREQYLMCPVEWFLQHAQLHDREHPDNVIWNPLVSNLPIGPKEDGRYWLTLDKDAEKGNLSAARAYVHAYAPSGRSYTDLQFYFFYAYNGPGTLHVSTPLSGEDGDAGLQPLGEHVGDWETCVLRIDNATKSLIGVWMSQHDSGQWFDEAQLDQLQRHGEQVILYASLNGHAVYPSVGPNPTHEGSFRSVSWYLRNDTDEGGECLDCAKHYQIVSALSVPQPRWINYPYRWGPENTHTEISSDQAGEIVKAAFSKLGFLPWNLINVVVGPLVAQIITLFKTDDLNGPEGPMQKDSWSGKYE